MKILKIIIVLIVFVLAWQILAYFRFLGQPAGQQGSERFVINTGESARLVSDNLKKSGLVSNGDYFYYYLRLNDLSSSIQAGDYELSQQMEPLKIARIITSGQAVSREKVIKIIEGWRLKDIDEYLAQSAYQDGEFLALASQAENFEKYQEQLTFLSAIPAGASLEGFMFPDTYRVYQDAGLEDIAYKMLDNFEKKIGPELRQEIERQGKTLYQIITMASLIEKEVRSEQDMKLVSGIFWNRLSVNQALESCATLAYILGVDKAQYSTKDTAIDNPYNTYRYPGLPPGPIANPGLKAIEAAVYPMESDYFYFLSRPDNKETVFSRTYSEHLRNKARYLD